MRKVGQRLEQDLDHDRQVVVGRVELVQLQQGQVGLQVVPGNIFVTMLKYFCPTPSPWPGGRHSAPGF